MPGGLIHNGNRTTLRGMGRRSWLGGVAVLLAGGALLAGQMSAFAASVYPAGQVGYDISYPQCTSSYPTGAFGIVGVNQGYPFTYYNPCFVSEWTAAQATAMGYASVYINTGYDPSYTKVDANHSTQDCVNRAGSVSGSSSQQRAWAVGCSEAERSVAYASCGSNVPGSCSSVISPAGWWLDVETANSWCGRPGTHCKDLTLNRYTLQGIVDTLQTGAQNPNGAPVGVYSTPSAWTTVVGSNIVDDIAADWRATGVATTAEASPYCSSTGFTGNGAPVWLVQYLPGSTDADYAC